MQRFAVYLCALSLATGLAVAQKSSGSGDRMNALQANNGQDRVARVRRRYIQAGRARTRPRRGTRT